LKLTSKKQGTVVGLDIEAGSLAAAEVATNGTRRLGRTGIAPLAPGVTREGEVADPDALSGALKELFQEQKLSRHVRVGVSNQRVIVRSLRMPLIESKGELETAIRFQAQDHIPMPLEQAVLDWQLTAKGVGEDNRQMDVVVVAARRDMVGALATALRSAGLRPVGIDVAAFGMIRALAGEASANGAASGGSSYEERMEAGAEGAAPGEEYAPAKLYCNLGDITDLAVARGNACLFTRVSSFGVEGIAQRLAERRGLTLEHARQWLVHVGLERPIEEIDGDAETVAATREVLTEGASKLADELRLSLEFYAAQEGAVAVEEVVACGPGTAIGGLVDHLQRELGYAFHVGRPAALAHLDEPAAARLTLSYGLALER
jgi:type IV pilus assembly protein PilM